MTTKTASSKRTLVRHGITVSASSAADEYLPKRSEFYVGFDSASPYAYWDDTQRGIKATLKRRADSLFRVSALFPAPIPPAIKLCIVSSDDQVIKKSVTRYWVCFDKANGHKGAHRYVWIFNSEEEARKHYARDQSNKTLLVCLPPIMVVAC